MWGGSSGEGACPSVTHSPLLLQQPPLHNVVSTWRLDSRDRAHSRRLRRGAHPTTRRCRSGGGGSSGEVIRRLCCPDRGPGHGRRPTSPSSVQDARPRTAASAGARSTHWWPDHNAVSRSSSAREGDFLIRCQTACGVPSSLQTFLEPCSLRATSVAPPPASEAPQPHAPSLPSPP